MDIDPRHLHELWRIAQESDPEAWCDEASDFGSQYLRGAGIPATTDYDDERTDEYGEPVKTGFLGTTHSWIRLKDGTIIDPTVSQFSNMVDGWPHHPEVPNVAVVPPGHPFANNYVGSEDYSLPTDYQDTREGRAGGVVEMSSVPRYADPDVPAESELRQFLRDGNAEGVHDQCYEVARCAKEQWPHLQYVEGRYYRAMDDGEGNPDLPGHAWLTTPSGTIIDTSHAQFNPSIGPLNIVSPNETHAYQRYLPDESPELHKILKDNGWVDYQGWPNRSNVLTDYQGSPEGRVREAMAADPHWLDNWIERNGPYLYHYIGSGAMENLRNFDSFQKGLLPWDHRENPSFTTHDPAEPSLGPRPGHVYLRAKPLTGNDGVPRGEEWRNIKVDLRKLDPENLVADEDNVFIDNRDAAKQWEEDQRYFEEENPHWADDPWDARGYSGGEFAEVNPHFFDGPAETAKSLESNHPTIAHRGPIPPEAMEFNYPARVAAIDQSMLSVIAAETTQQLLERMPETTNYISQPNEDGWTIQQPRTFKDLDAMGTMMSNCWAYGTPLSQQHYIDHPHWPKGVFPSVWHLNTKQDEEDYAEAARQGLIDAEGEPVWSHSAYDLDLNQKLPDHKRYYTLHDPHNIPRLAYDRDGELLGRHNSDPKPEYLAIWNELQNRG